MKSIISFIIILFLATAVSTATIFEADRNDPYLKSGFQKETKLKALLAENATFVEAFSRAFKRDFDTKHQYDTLMTLNVDDWEMHLFERRNEQIKFIKKQTLEKNLETYLRTEINYNYWHLLLAYSINRSNKTTDLKKVTSLPRVMTKALNKEKLRNQDLLMSKSYRAFIPYFVIYFNSESKYFQKYANGNKSMKDKGEFAIKYLNGNVLDYALYQLTDLSAKTLNTQTFSYWVSQVYDQGLRDELELKWYDYIAENEAKLAANQKSKKSKEEVAKLPALVGLDDEVFTFYKYRGKVIYVDFWASWCGPCRREFPYSKEMHASLTKKQKKEIVFMYISTDKDLEAWKKTAEKLKLNESGINAHSYEVGAKYLIRSIPRYMIINQKGEIINPDAPRPSNPETLQQLLELL